MLGTTSAPRVAVIATALCAFLATFALIAAPASAEYKYEWKDSFDGNGALHNPLGLAFDQTSGDVYTTDTSNNLVDKFNPSSGELVTAFGTNGQINGSTTPAQSFSVPWGLALDQSNGDLYVDDFGHGVVDKFDPSGNLITSFGTGGQIDGEGTRQGPGTLSAFGIAVDPINHDLLVANLSYSEIDVYNSGGEFQSQFGTDRASGPTGVAVNADGYVYVVGSGLVEKFNPIVQIANNSEPSSSPVTENPIVDSSGSANVVAIDTSDDDIYVENYSDVEHFDSADSPIDQFTTASMQNTWALGVDPATHAVYAADDNSSLVNVFAAFIVPGISVLPVSNDGATSATLNGHIDPLGGGDITGCHFEYGTSTSYGNIAPCAEGNSFSAPADVHADVTGLTTNTTYHFRLVASNAKGTSFGPDQTFSPSYVFGLSTEPPTDVTSTGATLNGSFDPKGEDTHYYFQYGTTSTYGTTTAVPPGVDAGSTSGESQVHFDLTNLNPFTTYHYRIVASNSAGTSFGDVQTFKTLTSVPLITESVGEVHSDRAVLHAQINPGGVDTTYHFEYGIGECSANPDPCTPLTASDIDIGSSTAYQGVSALLGGLSAGTTYHYRVVAVNSDSPVGGTPGPEHSFTTFPFIASFNDPCSNAHVRQQTGAAQLLDCRAYELVSAPNAGGYDVESDLAAGQTPFAGYPNAESPPRVLYGVHNGGIPGTGNPTDNGVDPYVATRTDSGWNTEYVGIPADDPYASGPFASTLVGADSDLESFAFSGPNICNPCFAEGSQGIPIHDPNGSLTQGMAGSLSVSDPVSAGVVKKSFAADGSHFVFGSDQQFENAGNPDNGNVTIYSRDLKTGTTEVVSTGTNGTAIADGANVAELDISSDGSRVLIGQLVSTDSAGNHYYHLYMHVAGNPDSIDLTPDAPDGALYDGMNSDGSKVYFTSVDKLTSDDTDSSADIYRADISDSAAILTRVSTGTDGTGNTNSCDPDANTVRVHWNTIGEESNCGAVAVGGGGGVAAGDGTIYFLSPELLDGPSNGVQNAPNLYIARPEQSPHFIATLESSANAPVPAPAHPFLRSFGSFGNVSGTAIDHTSGDVYVLDLDHEYYGGSGYVYKFDSSGHPVTSFGSNGRITVSGTYGSYGLPSGIAVDNDPTSPNHGDLYVPDYQDGYVRKYDSSGAHLADIGIGSPTGVAVDPGDGNVYISNSGGVSIFDTSGNLVTSFATISSPTGIAVDSHGNAYVINGGGASSAAGTTEKYDSSGTDLGQFDGNPSVGVAVDPADNYIYVNEGDQVVEFDAAGDQVGAPIGSGKIANSIGLAVDSGILAISDRSHTDVDLYGPPAALSDPSTDNPLVIDSVSAAEVLNTADFQVNPSGDDAVFTSTLPLTGYDNAAHHEVFRYDAVSDTLECVSCNPTSEQATGEATLASDGLSLTEDGRVFFNSTEGLVDRDLNEKMDVYEWSPQKQESEIGACHAAGGCVELISTGTNALDSSLLSADTNGTDVYFFTRDTLVSSDQNGPRVKIYDAREGGGFDQVPPPHQCQASDECHGASTQAPTPPPIRSIVGTPVGNATQTSTKCKKRFAKRDGKCVRKHRRKVHRHG